MSKQWKVEITGDGTPLKQSVTLDGIDISGALRSASITVAVHNVPKVVLEFAHPIIVAKQPAEVIRMVSEVRSQLELDLLDAVYDLLYNAMSNTLDRIDAIEELWKKNGSVPT